MDKVKSLIITGFGINCEEEMAAAYRLAGAEEKIVHLNDIFYGKYSIHNYHIINFPGGFSFGDDLGSGKVLANKIKYKKLANNKYLLDEIIKFLGDKKYILGVCNGFQALVKMGLLPDISGNMEQEVTLMRNDSGKFEDRWCRCSVTDQNTPFLKDINVIPLPVRHGEGKLVIKDKNIENAIVENHLNCLTYCYEDGTSAREYPFNPNGSQLNCAGLTDKTGHILGMMPHPEAYLDIYNNPSWEKIVKNEKIDTTGLNIFKNIVNKIENELL